MIRSTWMPAGLTLLLVAAVWVLLVRPAVGRLGDGYEVRYDFDGQARTRKTLDGRWSEVRMTGQRLDVALVATDARMVLQSDVVFLHADGTPIFDNAGVYAIDRHDRANLPGLGSTSRTGQFMFPPGVEPVSYTLWDSQFVGPRLARYRGHGEVGGLEVLRFEFQIRGLDETAAYSHLPDVPERYRAHTDGRGEIQVEPRTGLVLDYAEYGRSYFVGPGGGSSGTFFEWEARFTAPTRQAQVARAREARRRMLLAGSVIPGGLALGGLALVLAAALRTRSRPA